MTRPNPLLHLEELGARIQPAATPLIHTTAETLTHVIVSHPVTESLTGSGAGTFSNPVTANDLSVDTLTAYNFHGTANLAGLGAVTVSGTIHSVGFVLTGRATGQLTFVSAKGSVTVELTGPVQAGFSALPTTFEFKVIGHTGAYTNPISTGELSLTVTPQLVNYVAQPQGTFTLTI